MNISFKAQIEIDGGRKTSPNSVSAFYDQKIQNLRNKKALSIKTMDYLSSPEIQAKLSRLPQDDFVLFDTLSRPLDEHSCLDDSLELIYFSDDKETNDKLGLTKTGQRAEGKEFLIEHKIDSSTPILDKKGISKWLDEIIAKLK